MVRHLRFFIYLTSQPLSQMNYLRTRGICYTSGSSVIPDTLAWCILCIPFPPFHQLPLPRCFVVGGLLRLLWTFSSTLACRFPGLLWRAFLAHSGSCIGGPYPHHWPPTYSLHRLGVLNFSGLSFWCHLSPRLIVRFHCSAPSWRVSGVPCSLRSLLYWIFSGALDLIVIVWTDA